MIRPPDFRFRRLWRLLLVFAATTTRMEQLVVSALTTYAANGWFDRTTGASRIRIEKGDFLVAPRRVWNRNRRHRLTALDSTATAIDRPNSSSLIVNGTTAFFSSISDGHGGAYHHTAVLERPSAAAATIPQQQKLSIIVNTSKPKDKSDNVVGSRLLWARHLFSCLFCFSAGFGDVRAIRNFGGPVNMCTGGIVRAVLAAMERRWEDVWTPTLLVTAYVLGAMASRLAQKSVELHQRGQLKSSLKRTPPSPRDSSSSPSNISALCWTVVPLILAVFGVATWKQHCIRTCVAAQAFGFGLIHTTAQEVTGGSVVFAVTGHVMTASRLVVDHASAVATTTTGPTPSATQSLFQRLAMILSFALGVVAAAALWDHVLPLFSAAHRFEHIMMGAWYALLFALCSLWL